MTDTSPPISVPTTDVERNVSLDILRGFALLGILVMNIQSFAMIAAAYMNPTAFGDFGGANYWVWFLSHLLADQKFMTIFSLLFGAGIVLMADRQQVKGLSAAKLHYRRIAWLLVIGLLHAYLLWHGDILVIYALCGSVAFLFRKVRPWLLLVLGTLSIGVASAISALGGISMPHWPDEQLAQFEAQEWSPPQEEIDRELAVYRSSWWEQTPHRAKFAFYLETYIFLIFLAWRAGGLMLIGMALHRLGVLTGKRSNALYLSLIAVGGIVGIPVVLYGVHRNFAADWSITYSFFWGRQYNYWGSLLVSLGYLGGVMLVCKAGRLKWLTQPLAKVGQMALTNYLLQTIICTMIFYGHGFGQYGHFSRVQQIITVFAVWLVQIVVSSIWLRHFRFGPFEWVWRSLSYWRRQPMRRTQPD